MSRRKPRRWFTGHRKDGSFYRYPAKQRTGNPVGRPRKMQVQRVRREPITIITDEEVRDRLEQADVEVADTRLLTPEEIDVILRKGEEEDEE